MTDFPGRNEFSADEEKRMRTDRHAALNGHGVSDIYATPQLLRQKTFEMYRRQNDQKGQSPEAEPPRRGNMVV